MPSDSCRRLSFVVIRCWPFWMGGVGGSCGGWMWLWWFDVVVVVGCGCGSQLIDIIAMGAG